MMYETVFGCNATYQLSRCSLHALNHPMNIYKKEREKRKEEVKKERWVRGWKREKERGRGRGRLLDNMRQRERPR